ncbi:MAG: OmpA family protein [Bacteroidetes bacterium]|nr:OmpA family protein [Bacteroidota bacterium]
MKSLLVSFIFQIFCILIAKAQTDTLIYAEGKIINATTKEAISAKISYRSEPYGNTIGFLSGTSYRFPFFDNSKYSITVEAPGFATSKFLIDPAEANAERLVVKDIELGLPQSASVEAEATRTVGKVMRLDNLIFNAGTARIDPASYDELTRIGNMLKNNPNMVVQLEGHTDFIGDPSKNMKLSEERVDAVKDYLVSKGASKSRIKTKAFGGTQPLSRENTEEAHKMNRRVELRVLQN